MYHFIDVTEVSEGNLLPSEALKLNSEYIENLIPGYRTLAVSGREALSDRKSTRLNSSHVRTSRMPSSA